MIHYSFVTLQLANSVTPWDILLSLIAAATHDLDHPGVNQPFLIKTNHYLATLYKVSAILSSRLTIFCILENVSYFEEMKVMKINSQ